MNDDLFNELKESIAQAGRIRRGEEEAPSRTIFNIPVHVTPNALPDGLVLVGRTGTDAHGNAIMSAAVYSDGVIKAVNGIHVEFGELVVERTEEGIRVSQTMNVYRENHDGNR